MRRLLLSFTAVLTLVSCSHLKKYVPEKKLSLDKRWVRSTLSTNYYGARVLHRFEPIFYEDLIIQGNSIDGIVAYTQKNGRRVWNLKVKNGVEAGAVLKGDKLYFAAGDGYVYAAKAVNGQVLWKFPIKSEGIGSPSVSGETLIVVAGNNVAYALDTVSGKLRWPYKRPDTTNLSIRGASQPLISDDVAYIGFNDGYLVALDLASGKEIWQKRMTENRRFKDVDAKPVLDNGFIYASSYDGSLLKINAKSGEVAWKKDHGGYSAVTIVNDVVYLSSSHGYVIALSTKNGSALWKRPVRKGIATRPKYYNGYLIYGESAGRLYVVDAQTGKLLKSYHPGRGVTSSALINKKGEIYFISKDANLFAMKLARKFVTEELN